MGYKPVHFTDLGVTLDRGLNFELHLKNVYNLAAHKIYFLGKIRPYLTYIDYGDILYHKIHKQAINKIQRLQNRALRICLKSPARTPSDPQQGFKCTPQQGFHISSPGEKTT